MIRNFLVVALRNMRRQFLYSFINIVGLAIGLASTLVIFLFVYSEWSHDRHFKNGERIFRVGVSFFNMGLFSIGPEKLGEYLQGESTQIETLTRFQKAPDEKLWIGNDLREELVYHTDSNFFRVFSYDFLKGNQKTALAEPHAAVLSASMADKLFGDWNVLGREILVGKAKTPYVVTGIVDGNNAMSHLKSEIWLSWDIDHKQNYYWTSAAVYTYVLLKENGERIDLERALDRIVEKYVYPESGAKQAGKTLEQFIGDPNSLKFNVFNLREIYLGSAQGMELSPGGNRSQLVTFSVIAAVILALAVVNFVNLSTARATKRAREIGIRKSLGTSQAVLIFQFLMESVLVTSMAMVLALGLGELFSFAFFWIGGRHLNISLISDIASAGVLFLFAIGVGILAGLYPAVRMTSISTSRVLKGMLDQKGRPALRNGLIILQFTISISLIICTLFISRQLDFIATKDLGFNDQNVLTIDNLHLLSETGAIDLKEHMLSIPGVESASLHLGEPGSKAIISSYSFQTPNMTSALSLATYFGDFDYVNTLGFRLLKGRTFNVNLASDSTAVILNETALEVLQINGEPIGKEVNKGMHVIGVVSDFHWESLRNNIGPLAIMLGSKKIVNPPYSQLAIKGGKSALQDVVTKANAAWKQRVADEPMSYHFVDENFGSLLEKEKVLGRALSFFTGLAIIISCLGLFGLSAYTAEQRTKEIGIRKVLGASTYGLMVMLGSQFTRLVIISILVAVPLAWYIAKAWLESFAYKTQLSLWVFAFGAVTGLVICVLTVAYHSLTASRTNPTETLKYE
jgi:putative ABC transport system permease protein